MAAAYDISETANRVYALNHGLIPAARELATVRAAELAAHQADTWLLSPPCQPYCRMGRHRDLEDPRSQALLHLVEVLGEVRLQRLAMENVEGFAGSDAHTRLMDRLRSRGFQVREFRLCPTRFGFPNQRPRWFLAASRKPLAEPEPLEASPRRLGDFLDAVEDPELYLDDAAWAKHGQGLDLVRADDRRSCCFIGGYGRKFVGSGSFLRTAIGVRRFSPAEIARLMGFPRVPDFPENMPLEVRWKLLGNALNVAVARWLLRSIPD